MHSRIIGSSSIFPISVNPPVCLKNAAAGDILKASILSDMREFSAGMVFLWIILYGHLSRLNHGPYPLRLQFFCFLMVCCSIPLYYRVIHGGSYDTIH